ncbi:hypothetical protein F2Q68_00011988 [Brassica cretica]|uniref:Uncharacterized protein n=1 Tax=Brassica cretica TaxID=69181 RepID=A0A8S9KY46_BRACR|nr:hypothetical protein F2Q68_00011988 [Brassica cretica]
MYPYMINLKFTENKELVTVEDHRFQGVPKASELHEKLDEIKGEWAEGYFPASTFQLITLFKESKISQKALVYKSMNTTGWLIHICLCTCYAFSWNIQTGWNPADSNERKYI